MFVSHFVVSVAGILALTAAGPRSPQSQLPAGPSPADDDLIPGRTPVRPPGPKGTPRADRGHVHCSGRGSLSHSAPRESGDLGTGLGVRPQETPPWSPAALHSAEGRSPGHEGQEGDLHEDVPPEDKRAQRPQSCCGLRGRAQGTSTMAWTPLLLPLLTLCTGAAPQARPPSDQGSGSS